MDSGRKRDSLPYGPRLVSSAGTAMREVGIERAAVNCVLRLSILMGVGSYL